jgi:glycine/D-amino acid oxidase-like deaminating enzyme
MLPPSGYMVTRACLKVTIPHDGVLIVDIAVIGAGVIGCCIALELSQRGFNVILFDEGQRPLGGSSQAGFGSLTPFSDPYFDGQAIEHAAKGVELYRHTWLATLRDRTGINVFLQDLGLLKLSVDQNQLKDSCNHAERLRLLGYKVQMLNVDEVRALEPELTGKFAGALLLDEPWLDKEQYFRALIAALNAEPRITWYGGKSVTDIYSKSTHLSILVPQLQPIDVAGAVVCTGLHICPINGIRHFPLKWIRGDAVCVNTCTGRPLLKRHIYRSHGFITPSQDGRMFLGATYEVEYGPPLEMDPKYRDRIKIVQLLQLIQANEAILPRINECEISHVWRGWRPTPPDHIPILGPLVDDSRIVLATGFIGLGITMAPATAVAVGDYFQHGDPKSFPSTFAPSRFASSEMRK